MLIRLRSDSAQALYAQIADEIEAQIHQEALSPGVRLPPARTLAASLGVNMHTVLRAYGELESRGLVEKRKGRGGVIVAPDAGLDELARRLTKAARNRGLTRRQLIERVEAGW